MEYEVPLVAQTQGMSCWAASIAMILSWRDQISVTDVAIAANAGGTNYTPSMISGLDPNDRYILKRNGFVLDEPMCYTLDLFKSRIDSNGPLWVASLTPGVGPHIRVVRGYRGQMLLVNDPWPVNTGARYERSFGRFTEAMENLGAQELATEHAPIYVAYQAA